MIRFFYIFIFSIFLVNCSIKNVNKHHGVPYLEKKQKLLIVNQTNKNDIRKILGNPSTTSKFDKDLWIYVERVTTNSKLKNLGKIEIIKNDVLVLELDNYGILESKKLYNKDEMNEVKLIDTVIIGEYSKNSFIYNFMSSMRQKINDPLGKRAKKRKEANQR